MTLFLLALSFCAMVLSVPWLILLKNEKWLWLPMLVFIVGFCSFCAIVYLSITQWCAMFEGV